MAHGPSGLTVPWETSRQHRALEALALSFRAMARLHPRLRGDAGSNTRLAGAAGIIGHHPARPAAVRRLGLSLGGHGAPLPGSPPDPPRDAQGTTQPAADGGAKAYESSLGEDPRAGRTRLRAHRPVPQGPAAALHGLGARRGGDRADQLHAQPAAAGDDGAVAAAGARERMRSAHRERAPGTGQSEVQNIAKDNCSDPLTDTPRHAIDQAACGNSKQVLQTALNSILRVARYQKNRSPFGPRRTDDDGERPPSACLT